MPGGFLNYEYTFLIVETSDQPANKIIVPNYKASTYWPAFDYSPDGSMLVTTNKRSLDIYDTSNGSLIKTISGHSKDISCATWSGDGAKIISGDFGGTIKIWDFSEGKELRSITGLGNVSKLLITPDNTKLVGIVGKLRGGDLKVWDINNGNELLSIKGTLGWGHALSPDGQSVAASFTDDMTTRVYSVNDGALKYKEESNNSRYYTPLPLAFQENDKLLIYHSWGENRMRLVDIASNSQIWEETMASPNQVAINKDGDKIISFIALGFVHIFDANTGEVISSFTTPQRDIYAIAVSSVENKLATLSRDGTIRFWDF